jgi:hypothetical protein
LVDSERAAGLSGRVTVIIRGAKPGGPSGRVSNEIRDDGESEGSEGDRGHSATARLLQSACR